MNLFSNYTEDYDLPRFTVKMVKSKLEVDIVSTIIHNEGERHRFVDYLSARLETWIPTFAGEGSLVYVECSISATLRMLVNLCALMPLGGGSWLWDPSKLGNEHGESNQYNSGETAAYAYEDQVEYFDGAEDFEYVGQD